MAKLTIHETPTETLIKQAANEIKVTDETGRVFTLKKPSLLSQSRIMRVVGNEPRGYIDMVAILLFISAIDDELIFTPSKISEIEALFQRLDVGNAYALITNAINKDFTENAEQDKDNIKK